MNTNASERFVVITGGPGAGKSTLIAALGRNGFASVPEAARAIIRDQVAIGGPARPMGNSMLQAEIDLAWQMRSYRQATDKTGTVFFDRGVPDVIGHYLMLGQAVPPHVSTAAGLFRYHTRVFVAPPWPQIYVHDEERTQNFDHAVRAHDATVDAYTSQGYQLITLPRTSVDDRLRFVLRHLDTV